MLELYSSANPIRRGPRVSGARGGVRGSTFVIGTSGLSAFLQDSGMAHQQSRTGVMVAGVWHVGLLNSSKEKLPGFDLSSSLASSQEAHALSKPT